MTITTSLKDFSCSREGCGITFAIQGSVADVMQEHHEFVWCPRGHRMSFSAETELDRLRAKSLRLESQLDFERASRHTAEVTAKRERTRRKNVEKRVSSGVCPWCHRHFANVERHAKSKHPGKACEQD